MNVLKLLGANAQATGGQNIAFRASAISVSPVPSVTVPSSVVAGDLLVLYDRAINISGSPTEVTPTGFTQILSQLPITTQRYVCSFKIADGTEAGTSIAGMTGTSGSSGKILFAFSTNGASSAIAYDVGFESTNSNPIAQTIISGGAVPPLVSFAFMRQDSETGQSFSPTQDGTATFGTSKGYYKIYNSSPSNITADCGDGGSNNVLMSFFIEVN